MQRLLRPGARQSPSSGSSAIGARLALGLGPNLHWTGWLGGLVVVAALLGALCVTVLLFPRWAIGQGILWGSMLCIPIFAPTFASQAPVLLWASRREQVLLRLLPGVPQGAALNRWLARRLALQYAVLLAVLAGVAWAMFVAFPAPSHWLQTQNNLLGALALCPLLIPMFWRDWSCVSAETSSSQTHLLLAMLFVCGTAGVWVLWLQGPWWALGLISGAALVPLAWWRWSVISRAPTAWPVGRLRL
jgi:hypothetical protein